MNSTRSRFFTKRMKEIFIKRLWLFIRQYLIIFLTLTMKLWNVKYSTLVQCRKKSKNWQLFSNSHLSRQYKWMNDRLVRSLITWSSLLYWIRLRESADPLAELSESTRTKVNTIICGTKYSVSRAQTHDFEIASIIKINVTNRERLWLMAYYIITFVLINWIT